MYIIKNAFKCIGRSKGRNILIGVIVLVISVSACIGLSIRQAAEKAKAEALNGLSVTASISVDRQYMMNKMRESSTGGTVGKGGFDKSQFSSMMGSASSLSLEDYLKYSKAQSVSDFYYQMTVFANGTDDFSPVTTENESESSSGSSSSSSSNSNSSGTPTNQPANDKSMPGGDMKGGFTSADFQIVGYSEQANIKTIGRSAAESSDCKSIII